jgi:aryl-alcohol dehydrogenase-like predicted oxidoreductase
MNPTNRRDFLKAAAASLAAAQLGSPVLAAEEPSTDGLPKRPLGRSGEMVPIVGLGGYHVRCAEDDEALAIIDEAIDNGMTFFDNSWDYHAGRSEELMGKALTGAKRDKVFLMTKVCNRDYEGAKEHLDDSLRRLKTDRIDLWQFHEINWSVDPDWIFDRGAIRAAIEARKAGKVRYIGFTGHRHFAHHLKMLRKPFDWDTVQMPINILDATFRSFQNEVLPECKQRKVSAIGMKALAGGILPAKLGIPAELCRRFALSLPLTTLVCGIRSREELRQDLAIARDFKPLKPEELLATAAKYEEPAGKGDLEPFKTTDYGSAYHKRQHEGL